MFYFQKIMYFLLIIYTSFIKSKENIFFRVLLDQFHSPDLDQARNLENKNWIRKSGWISGKCRILDQARFYLIKHDKILSKKKPTKKTVAYTNFLIINCPFSGTWIWYTIRQNPEGARYQSPGIKIPDPDQERHPVNA